MCLSIGQIKLTNQQDFIIIKKYLHYIKSYITRSIMEKIKITSDSAADLNELFEQNGVDVIPLFVNLGQDEYLDGVTVNPDDIYKFVAEKNILPKTAARNSEDLKEFFKKYTDDGYKVVHFSISDKMSLMHKSACAAAEELGNVYVVDSKSLSTGIGLLVLSAVDMVKEGKTAEEIYKASLARVPHVQASFVVNTMDYLYKGGRCSGLAAFAATKFKIKPSLLVVDGEITVYNKYLSNTGKRAIRKYLEDITKDFKNPDNTRVFITHTKMEDGIVDIVREFLQEKMHFKTILETTAGSTITSHCGPGTLGILYINDGDKQN